MQNSLGPSGFGISGILFFSRNKNGVVGHGRAEEISLLDPVSESSFDAGSDGAAAQTEEDVGVDSDDAAGQTEESVDAVRQKILKIIGTANPLTMYGAPRKRDALSETYILALGAPFPSAQVKYKKLNLPQVTSADGTALPAKTKIFIVGAEVVPAGSEKIIKATYKFDGYGAEIICCLQHITNFYPEEREENLAQLQKIEQDFKKYFVLTYATRLRVYKAGGYNMNSYMNQVLYAPGVEPFNGYDVLLNQKVPEKIYQKISVSRLEIVKEYDAAMELLLSLSLRHADLKPENICFYLDESENVHLMFIDHGAISPNAYIDSLFSQGRGMKTIGTKGYRLENYELASFQHWVWQTIFARLILKLELLRFKLLTDHESTVIQQNYIAQGSEFFSPLFQEAQGAFLAAQSSRP